MLGNLILLVCMWVCAGIFLGFGLYARRLTDPMWFWSGTTVPRDSVTDVPAYNQANSRMWIFYSLPWWIGGLLSLFSALVGAVIAVAACTAGLGWLLWFHGKIEKRYRKQ